MKIGFTGTQQGMTEPQKISFEALFYFNLDVTEFHHGCCIGSDTEASHIISDLPNRDLICIVAHPPIDQSKVGDYTYWQIRPPRHYLDRNHDIVDETDLLVATPKEDFEILRSGTWATIRYAYKVGNPIKIIYPDGVAVDYQKEMEVL